MTLPFLATLLSAVAILITCGCVGLHEILIGPDRPNYPTAPMHVRALMFCWMVALGYAGIERLSLLVSPDPHFVTPGQLAGSLMVAAVHAVMLEQHMRRWLPARLQLRIKRLWDIASCRKRPALAEARARSNAALRPGVRGGRTSPQAVGPALASLALAGAEVIAPHEIPPEWMPDDAPSS